MSRKYGMLVVEGPSDQAVVERALKLLGFRRFGGQTVELDPFWKTEARIVPTYPPASGNLYERLAMPSIVSTDARSVAVYAGGGSKLTAQVSALLANHDLHQKLDAFGVIADSDKKAPADVAERYRAAFQELFPGFPGLPGEVVVGPPSLGVFVFPTTRAGASSSTSCSSAARPSTRRTWRARAGTWTTSARRIEGRPGGRRSTSRRR